MHHARRSRHLPPCRCMRRRRPVQIGLEIEIAPEIEVVFEVEIELRPELRLKPHLLWRRYLKPPCVLQRAGGSRC